MNLKSLPLCIDRAKGLGNKRNLIISSKNRLELLHELIELLASALGTDFNGAIGLVFRIPREMKFICDLFGCRAKANTLNPSMEDQMHFFV